ncbi:DUF5004 domain-containing protein [Pedobacter sp. SL55]|uniref:DUF5004 domain-containing protein n=1 Tax=Pedobacter sp. SL55 TaxID=2995161 RepID=UPI00227049A9|nr:DUF5004 domain-containing protein [Pedobacter sp. SL55]WAC42481.1 DUF5004 domain-containing protein [Pedobacter sp. SL55]
MKTLKYLSLLACILFTFGCKPEDFGPITSKVEVVKQMQGTWGLTKVTQVDQDAATKGFPYKELDITNIYPYKDLTIALQGDASGNPTNFAITNGNAPKIADLTSGTWTVDDATAPTAITLKNGTVTNMLKLGSYAGLSSGKLYLTRNKSINGKVIISYKYEFTKK